FEAIQRKGQAVAARLDERFFPCPAAVERAESVVHRKGGERPVLAWSEEPGRQIQDLDVTLALDVYANLPSCRDRQERSIARVGEIESDTALCLPQYRLSIRVDREPDRRRRNFEASAEDDAHHRVSRDEPSCVFGTDETGRACSLIIVQPFKSGFVVSRVDREQHDVHVGVTERWR